MSVLLLGATGVLGRNLLPHLAGRDVVGVTRSAGKVPSLELLGARGAVCDAYDADALRRLAEQVRPELVVNFLTDLAGEDFDANARLRRRGGANVVAAARAAGARRLVVESVAFPLEGEGGAAVEALERGALESGLEAVVLRFGLFWGPGTWHQEPGEGRVHVADAARRAAELLDAAPGVYVVGSSA